jgi:phage shock protein A
MLKRMFDIVRSDLNDLLDKAEDPEKLIDQYLLDAREHYHEAQGAVTSAIESEKLIHAQYDEAQKAVKQWEGRAELAVKSGNDTLAKEALIRKNEAAVNLAGLEGPLAGAKAQADAAKEQFRILGEKIKEAEAKSSILKARAKTAKAGKETSEALNKISSSDPLSAMGGMENKIRSMEAKAAAAMTVADAAKDPTEEAFKALESGTGDVDAQLAELKKKHSPEPK